MSSSAWDQIARVYDLQLRLERRPITGALDLADPGPKDRLLDLGTGTGAVLRELARRQPRPATAIGLDRSDAMLARVPSLPAGWSLERGDVTELPFPSQSFDVVTVSYLFHLLDAPILGEALGEIRRVLKPGGLLATVTPIAPRGLLRLPYEETVAALVRLTGSSLGLRPFDPGPELRGCGLEPVKARYVPLGYPSLCVLARAQQGPAFAG